MIHAEYGVELAFDCAMENGIGRNRSDDSRFSILDFRLELSNRRRDNLEFFAANLSRFTRVRIEAGDRDARRFTRSTSQKIEKQQADTDDLRLLQRAGDFAQRNVRGDKRDGEFAAGQTHGEIFYTAAFGEELGST